MLLALRGRVPLGGLGGAACVGAVAASSGAANARAESAAGLDTRSASSALGGALAASSATLDEAAASGATAGSRTEEC